MTPSTTAVPCVKSSTAAKATSAHRGHWAHHLSPLLDRRDLERGAAFDGDGEVGAERGRDAHTLLPLESCDRVLRSLRRLVDVVDRQIPCAHALLDRGDLPVRRARLLDCVDVGEAVGPFEVRDDDHLVRADHGLVKVARRRHREADVGATPAYLHLVVHHHRPPATFDDDLRDRGGLRCVVVVADDRDDVVLLDGHADVHDERRVLQQALGLGNGCHLISLLPALR